MEDRFLTAGGLHGAAMAGAMPALLERRQALMEARMEAAGGIQAEAWRPVLMGRRPGIGPGLGRGLVRLALPATYEDYGVVSIWNNTNAQVGFQVGASTYNNGLFYNFALNPGQYRSFYASAPNGNLPVFAVRFGAGAPPITLPNVNLIFEARAYVPPGTSGWPYAINLGVNGYYLSYI